MMFRLNRLWRALRLHRLTGRHSVEVWLALKLQSEWARQQEAAAWAGFQRATLDYAVGMQPRRFRHGDESRVFSRSGERHEPVKWFFTGP